ncbi:DUF6577 family protein [Crassaminicella profunda]|uniref:DUF6577 family protein n=1 Tax=Crassaminicella profunda TaxID=1286698 RepID=UPI001CA6D5E1|nr:DUF6577 family protein [Crassaminicella profunda]QZY55138.1 hypothetical protein K7H06_19380 [Crassaminicella profunda]
MKDDKLKIGEIIDYFGYEKPISSKELYEFYTRYEEGLNRGTFRWRVYDLKNKGIIRSLKRGIYIIETRRIYKPTVNLPMKRIYNYVKRKFPYIDICIWNTSWLHDFMNHQPFVSLSILEVDKDVLEIVFQLLREKRSDVYLNPKEESIDQYILNENVIILKPLIKESPIIEYEKVKIPKIEKILVDAFVENNLLRAYQGQELINIFERVYEEYSINVTTLHRYARNRGAKEKLLEFIVSNTSINEKYI